jgi:hypothetical protein
MKNIGCCRKIVALVVLFQAIGSRAADIETAVVADLDHRSLGEKRKSEYSTHSMKKAKKSDRHSSSSASKYYKSDDYYYKSMSVSGSGGGRKHKNKSEKGGSHASKPSFENKSNSHDKSSSSDSSKYTKKYKKIKKRSSDDGNSKPEYEASKFLAQENAAFVAVSKERRVEDEMEVPQQQPLDNIDFSPNSSLSHFALQHQSLPRSQVSKTQEIV